ncbi:MAG: alpha/beta hydrolase family protein [Bacteroidota bacterium]
MKTLFLTLALLAGGFISAQKKIIDHTIYNDWKRVGDILLSNDGKYSVYTIKPHRGDGYLYIINNETGKKDSVFKGVSPKFTADSKVLLFKITAGFDTLRKSELNKVKKDKWPKDTLGIWYAANDSLVKIPRVKEFVVAGEGGRFAYLSQDNVIPSDKTAKSKKKKKKKKKGGEEGSSDGNLLTVRTTDLTEKSYFKNITAYKFSENGDHLAYVMHKKVKADSFTISLFDFTPGSDAGKTIFDTFTSVPEFEFDKSGNKLVYLASQDTAAESKVYQMHLYDYISGKKTLLVDVLQGDFAQTKSVSPNFTPYFSEDATKVFFGIAEKPKVEPKDSLLESEKAKLDLWHWKDDRLQPQQLVELSRDEKETWFAVYDLNASSFTVIENDSIGLRHNAKNPSPYVLAYNERPYESYYNWEYPNKRDVYRVNIFTGETKLLRKADAHGSQLSPSGKFYTYFDEKDLQQYVMNIESGETSCITCGTKAEWLEDVNGMPVTPGPFGGIDWMRGENELLIASKYDIYKYDLQNKRLRSFIDSDAEKNKIRYSYSYWSFDSLYFDLANSYVRAFFEKDKSESFFQVKMHGEHIDLLERSHSDHAYSGFRKAKNGSAMLFQKASLLDYPDIYLTDFNKESEVKRISVTNPQQSEYNWATVELVQWKSYSGIPLEGLLYKPENYDPSKKYPLLVYFYEMYSDELHNHYAPKPTASIIYPTEYASAGYLVLIPDIRYQAGHPAKGAYDCIMSGTDFVLKNYPAADSARMGLQGQSWGGYQTAQLITMTTRYRAAMAGAPVGNMFSAYGGIRWGSGLNRQFQYERTQSRIGKTIWEAPELYVENSPVFHLPKVATPLLIMHNDADGAVPWYQGIELFTGLKRLGKPVWMLNYNGDDHNLMKNANRIDLSIRMRQFFDHYLLDAPAPIWLEDGLPALQKGKNYGLDLKMK